MVMHSGSILTSTDRSVPGHIDITNELREKVCLFDNGRLLVSSSHTTDHDVLSFRSLLKKKHPGVLREVVEVKITEISDAYKSASGGSDIQDATRRQYEVVERIKTAVNLDSSDIHIIMSPNETKIRYRVNGDLLTIDNLSSQHGYDIAGTIYQSMCDVADPTFNPKRPQDARLRRAFLSECGLFGARFASRPTDDGLLVVLRLLYDRSGRGTSLSALGYLPQQVTLLERMLGRSVGVNILSGPTGSGKSTTLECVMRIKIAEEGDKINLLTIEDPPEYAIPGAVQTPILCDRDDHEELAREWARSIRNSMRLDPDLIMVGEIRDHDSARASIQAAMTGHPIWTTLHANDSVAILKRLEDIGVDAGLITDAKIMTGLANQSLVSVLCGHCKLPYLDNKHRISKSLQLRIDETCKDQTKMHVVGDGCNHCNKTGIVGRSVVAEVIMPTKPFMSIYRSQGPAEARQYWVNKMDGITKCQHVLIRVQEGVLDPAMAEKICPLDEDLLTLEQVAVEVD